MERAIAWMVAGVNRRLRYRGWLATIQWPLTRTATLNFRRLVNPGLDHNGAWVLEK